MTVGDNVEHVLVMIAIEWARQSERDERHAGDTLANRFLKELIINQSAIPPHQQDADDLIDYYCTCQNTALW